MRKRRRSQGVWFPMLGQEYATDERYSGQNIQLNSPASNEAAVSILPVTFDRSVEPEESTGSYDLQALIGNCYLLRRIVGKFHACMFADATAGTPSQLKVALAFFVARQDEINANGDLPIGAVSPGDRIANYNPLGADQTNEPWIWRRTWVLQNNSQVADDTWGVFPSTTAGYGSVVDGPHIDAKTSRMVAQDERLFYAVAAQWWPLTNRTYTYTQAGSIQYDLDVRIFGQPRRSRNRGAF